MIVSDDGPHHDARALIELEFPWARWVGGPRRGPAANRNNGARLATGEWIAFTDDDCIPGRDWLAGYASATGEGADVALEGRTISAPGCTSIWDDAPTNMTGGWFWSCNIALRRALFEGVGGFDENYPWAAMEDVDLRRALASRGIRPRFVPAAEVNHPARHVGPAKRLEQLPVRLESHVYYALKWSRPSRWALLSGLCLHFARHWVIGPLRREHAKGLALAVLYPVVLVTIFTHFGAWNDVSRRRLRERPPRNLGDPERGRDAALFG